jgi:hypothetical protein
MLFSILKLLPVLGVIYALLNVLRMFLQSYFRVRILCIRVSSHMVYKHCYSQDVSTGNHASAKVHEKQAVVEPLFRFDHTTVEPTKYRPFKKRAHVAMGKHLSTYRASCRD